MDDHLHTLPEQTLNLKDHDEDEWHEVSSTSDDESISSHEFGVEWQNTEEESEDEELITQEAYVKSLAKHEKRKLGHHIHVMKKIYEAEARRKKVEEERKQWRTKEAAKMWKTPQRRFRILEVFTWSCMLSLTAVARGWEMLEPVSLPLWNLLEKKDREEAHKIIDEACPDLLAVAWPCNYWSPLQNLNYKTEEEKEILGMLRQEERVLLDFVKEVVWKQRARGGTILGKNPLLLKAWQEPAIEEAFSGLAHGRTDMCAHNLRRPDNKMLMKKPARLAGTPEIIRAACKTYTGNHSHAPVMGAMKINGKWTSVSEFAGGYTRSFSIRVLQGAEEFLKKRREGKVFGIFIGVPEERFTAHEEEIDEKQMIDLEEEIEQKYTREALEGLPPEEQNEDEEVRTEEPGREKAEDIDKVMNLHRRLGHPAPENLTRMLRLAGVKKKYVEISKKLLCPTCNDMRAPDRPRAVRSNMRPTVFNEVLHVDLKYAKDVKKQLYMALSMVDDATNYHQAMLLKNREPEKVARALVEKWLSLFGPPKEIYMDQGGEFETEFVAILEDHGILSHVTGAYAPWQNLFAERHGGLLAMSWNALIHEYQVTNRKGMKMTLACAVQAKNQVVTRRGYSAETLAFGRESNFPDLLDDETLESHTLSQALCIESQVAK